MAQVTENLCPKCGQPMTLEANQGMFRCPNGHKRAETLDEASERIRAEGQRPVLPLTFKGKVEQRALSLFESAQVHLWRGNMDAALRALQDAIDVQPEFSDAHLWYARTTTDPKMKREHLERLLAHDPGHLEGLRDLMVLDGKLTPEEAERSRTSDAPILRRADRVESTTETLKCPVCGGMLTVDEVNKRVICKFCGHTAALDATRGGSRESSLGAAMIERRAKGVEWLIGERLQHCQECGAERTIPQGRLSGICPFCNAPAVIVRDAVDSFEQPDRLIRFELDEDAAKDAIRDRLKSADERLYALNTDNKVARAMLEAVYLPFWMFDAQIEVSQTITDNRAPVRRDQVRDFKAYENVRFQEGLIGIGVPAVRSPAPQLVRELGKFNTECAEAYDSRLLATFPAELYSIDFEEASLEARSMATAEMRARHAKSEHRLVEISVFAFVQQMTFSLMLMPVWVGTLIERDGDVRPVLVNGQSGRVVFGSAH